MLPLCRDQFADATHGGFHEQLDAGHAPVPGLGKRLLAQCRQLYVLSHAALLGDASGTVAAERGYAFLRRAYRDDAHGGWFFRASAAGEPTDRSKDCYGHAFVLFALAWLHRAFAAPDAIALAEATFGEIEAHLAAPDGAFWDGADEAWQPMTRLRRQNPHMHLLEAVLALHAATGAAQWLAVADRLVRLLQRFLDPATGTLGEFFATDWTPDPARGGIVEPGHHFEWVWLLDAYATAGGGIAVAADAERLFGFAARCVSASGMPDEVGRDGHTLSAGRRIWPLTEAIKAHAVRGAGEATERLIGQLFRDFLRPDRDGWIERLGGDGIPVQSTLPATTPYHLFLAAAEASR